MSCIWKWPGASLPSDMEMPGHGSRVTSSEAASRPPLVPLVPLGPPELSGSSGSSEIHAAQTGRRPGQAENSQHVADLSLTPDT
jgi:hypothetical protein